MSKKKIVIILVVIFVLAGGGIGFSSYLQARRSQEAKEFRQESKQIWDKVVRGSSSLEKIVNKTRSKKDLKQLNRKLSKSDDLVTKELYRAASSSFTATSKYIGSKRKLVKALDDYSDYLAKAEQVTLRFSKGKGKKNDIKELKNKAKKAKKSSREFVKKTKWIEDNIGERVFAIPLRLQLISEKNKLESGSSLIEEAEERAKTIVEARRKKEAENAEDVSRSWLEGEIERGTEKNWELASTALKNRVLEGLPPEQQTKETYLAMFREGEMHFQLVSYEVAEVFIITYEEALTSIVSVRRDIDGNQTPPQQEELPLIKENENWLVDDVGF